MRNFQQLEIWQRSHQLTLRVYTATQSFPKEEIYGLTSQMRRSSSSVPTNIAEGCGRNSSIEFNRFLVIATGSLSELQYQFILSRDLKYFSEPIFKELFDEASQIKKMIYSYCQRLKADS
jgi:four helix bundle protein